METGQSVKHDVSPLLSLGLKYNTREKVARFIKLERQTPLVTQYHEIRSEPFKNPLKSRKLGHYLLLSTPHCYAVNQLHYLSLQTPKNLCCTSMLHIKYIIIANKFIHPLYFCTLFFEQTLLNDATAI
jgi:hypothetical protein